jgi:integrase
MLAQVQQESRSMPKAQPVRVDLTDRYVKAIKPPPAGTRRWIGDLALPNFGVRVTDKGQKTWMVRRRAKGSTTLTWHRLGSYPDMSLAQARTEARHVRATLAEGKTPKQEEEERQHQEAERHRAEQERREHTFGAIAEQFITRYLRHLRSAKPTESLIRSTLLPVFADRPAGDIRRRDIIKLVEAVEETRGPAIARTALAVTSKMFNWALNRDIAGLEFNPASRIGADLLGPPPTRDRVLTDEELRSIWRATAALDYPWQPLYRLLMATGQRLHEISDLSWSEIDLEKATLTIPASRMKGKAVHIVPLAPVALGVLRDLPRFSFGDFVFSTTGGRRPVGAISQAKARLDCKIAEAGEIPPWRVHDLRRTMRSNLSALGIQPVVAEAILAHRQRGVIATYDRYEYLSEKRDALEKWEVRLLSIVDANIVYHPANAEKVA